MPTDRPETSLEPTGHPGVGVRPAWEPGFAVALAIFFIIFGYNVLQRSAYQERRRTDAGVFFRAGHAVRAGENPYRVPDDNDWYFLYPPAEAALFVPLADPPNPATSEDPAAALKAPRPPGYLPYPVSIVLWYALSVGCLILSVECLARALLRGSPDPRIRAVTPARGGWWSVRIWPLLMCLPDILSTLSRGQVNLAVLAAICSGIYLLSTGRKFWGGFSLAGAAFIKVFPGLLLIDVLTRRGWRATAGYCFCGLATMVIAPALIFGPTRAIDYTKEFADRVLIGGIMHRDDRLQAGTDFANTDNQSIQGSLHNLTNIATPRGQRPSAPSTWVKFTHGALSIALLTATLLIGLRSGGGTPQPRSPDSALAITLRIGMLCAVMIMAVPMCHRHYYAFLLPACAALVYASMSTSRLATPRGWIMALVVASPVLIAITKASDRGLFRDLPIPLAVNFAIWGTCAWLLARECAARRSNSVAVAVRAAA